MSKLTGKTRLRVLTRLFRPSVLILQVQVSGFITTSTGGYVDSEKMNWWIDASAEHLLTFNKQKTFDIFKAPTLDTEDSGDD